KARFTDDLRLVSNTIAEGNSMKFIVCLVLFSLVSQPIAAQQASQKRTVPGGFKTYLFDLGPPQTPAANARNAQKKDLTLADAVDIFLQQNLEIVAARSDVETADAEKLTARLRPNPQLDASFEDLPLDFSGPFFHEQEIAYGISQTIEMGGKRRKR